MDQVRRVMLAAIVPVKRLECAKTRLSSRLDPSQRAGLCLAMLSDVLAALMASPELDMVLVTTPDSRVMNAATDQGAVAVADRAGTLNGAVVRAVAEASGFGATAALVIPGDVPLIIPADVAALAASLPSGEGIALSPSWDWGTGALLLRPPGAIEPAFGARSFERHLANARRTGIPAVVRRLPNLASDLDRPADLKRFLQQKKPTRTGEWLTANDVFSREDSKCM